MLRNRYQKKTAKAAQDSVASANEVAEETLSQLRVVRTFGTEKEELNRFLSLAVSDPTPLVSNFQLSILVSHKVMIHALHCFLEGFVNRYLTSPYIPWFVSTLPSCKKRGPLSSTNYMCSSKTASYLSSEYMYSESLLATALGMDMLVNVIEICWKYGVEQI